MVERIKLLRRYSIFAAGLFMFSLGQITHASTLVVGTCKPGTSFSTIQAAVNAASPGSTIDVCPGTYPEQVTIAESLTLQGVVSANSARPVITVPTSGFKVVTSVFVTIPVAPQVLVSAGQVNITNITVDGVGNTVNEEYIVGIFYDTGSSGVVRGVTTRGQSRGGMGVGIWAENGGTTSQSVTIENSSAHDVDEFGIFVGSNQTPPSLTATVRQNTVVSTNIGIVNYGSEGTLTNNVAGGGGVAGIYIGAGSTGSASNNTVLYSPHAAVYVVADGFSVKSNILGLSSNAAVFLATNGAIVESNTITAAIIGIQFNCHTGTVSNNIIRDSTTGLDGVPSSVVSVNSYDNVDTIRTGGCAAAAQEQPALAIFPPTTTR